MKVDVQVSHPDNSARDTTEIEKDSRRVQEMPGTMARISPLRRASLEFMTPLEFRTPDGADYFLPPRPRRGRVVALQRIWRRVTPPNLWVDGLKSKGPREKSAGLFLLSAITDEISSSKRVSSSRRERVLDQLDPIRGTVDDRLVVEIIGRMMQAGAVAVAAEDERARPRLQHIGEIFRAHHRRHLMDIGVARNFLRHLRGECRLRGVIDDNRIAALVRQIDLRARHLRHAGDDLAHPLLNQ